MSAAPAPTIVPLVEQAAFKVDLAEEQEAKYERITRRLQEVTSAEIMRKVLSENRSPVGYWGVLEGQICYRVKLKMYRQCHHRETTYRLLCAIPQDCRLSDGWGPGE